MRSIQNYKWIISQYLFNKFKNSTIYMWSFAPPNFDHNGFVVNFTGNIWRRFSFLIVGIMSLRWKEGKFEIRGI